MAKHKTKRYDADGLSTDDQTASDTAEASAPPSEKSEDTAPAKPQSFGAAFKAARASGDSTFTYNGKKYTTEMASDKASAPAKSSGSSTGSVMRTKPTESKAVDSKSYDPNAINFGDKKVAPKTEAPKRSSINDSDYNPRLGKYGSKSAPSSGGRTRTPERSSGRPGSSAMKKGGVTKSSASNRADGIAMRGKTKGRYL